MSTPFLMTEMETAAKGAVVDRQPSISIDPLAVQVSDGRQCFVPGRIPLFSSALFASNMTFGRHENPSANMPMKDSMASVKAVSKIIRRILPDKTR